MNFLLDYTLLLTILLIIVINLKKHPEIKKILLIAFILRAICVIIDQSDLIVLPDSKADASNFELKAREFSRSKGYLILYDFFKNDSFLISRIISIFYTTFGESKMLAQSISVSLGTASVYLVYLLSILLWDFRSAIKAAWTVAFFPTLVLYSSLALREIYIIFFLLLGLISIANFFKKKLFHQFIITLGIFYILSLFHGPLMLGGLIFILCVVFATFKEQLINLTHFKINIVALIIMIISLILLILFFNNTITMQYIGGLKSIFSLEIIINRINFHLKGTASYPSWLIINSNFEFFTKGIIKIIYFLYGPFLLSMKNSFQIIGFFDSMLYMILSFYLINNWKSISTNPITLTLFLILLAYVVVYGIGVGNFGTGIRHKSKFVVIFIVLAAPKIHKFIFSAKKRIYKN